MTDFNIESAKKERGRLLAEIAKLRQKVKAFDEFITAFEATDATSNNRRVQDSTKAQVRNLISELLNTKDGQATKEEIKAHLVKKGIKIGEGTLNVYMSKNDDIEYDEAKKCWVLAA